jgi:hypothetical protein
LVWAIDAAIRRRPANVNNVVLYVVDSPVVPVLNFGTAFAAVFAEDIPTLLGLLGTIRFFNPGASSAVLQRLLRHYVRNVSIRQERMKENGSWREWVSDIKDVPCHVAALKYDDRPDSKSAHLVAALDSRFGGARPTSMSDVFNSCPESEERLCRWHTDESASSGMNPLGRRYTEEMLAATLHNGTVIKGKSALVMDNADEWMSPATRRTGLRCDSPRGVADLCAIPELASEQEHSDSSDG